MKGAWPPGDSIVLEMTLSGTHLTALLWAQLPMITGLQNDLGIHSATAHYHSETGLNRKYTTELSPCGPYQYLSEEDAVSSELHVLSSNAFMHLLLSNTLAPFPL